MSLTKYWCIERISRASYFHSPLYFTCAEISTSMESTIQVESGTQVMHVSSYVFGG